LRWVTSSPLTGVDTKVGLAGSVTSHPSWDTAPFSRSRKTLPGYNLHIFGATCAPIRPYCFSVAMLRRCWLDRGGERGGECRRWGSLLRRSQYHEI
jgi:hypothetical protein